MAIRYSTLAKAVIPPIFAEFLERIRPSRNGWHGDYSSWSAAVADSSGYDAELIFERVMSAALKVKRGEAVYERDSVVFDEVAYSWALLAGVMWVAARTRKPFEVVDFGGALGSSYFQNRAFVRSLPDVRWNVVEQPRFVEIGNRDFADDQLRFYPTIDACFADGTPELIVLSGVLQYLEDPHTLLRKLEQQFRFVIIDLTPVHTGAADRLTVQTVPPSIYPASYPCWMLSESRLLESLRAFNLVAGFDAHIGQDVGVGNLRAGYRGYILERSS